RLASATGGHALLQTPVNKLTPPRLPQWVAGRTGPVHPPGDKTPGNRWARNGRRFCNAVCPLTIPANRALRKSFVHFCRPIPPATWLAAALHFHKPQRPQTISSLNGESTHTWQVIFGPALVALPERGGLPGRHRDIPESPGWRM